MPNAANHYATTPTVWCVWLAAGAARLSAGDAGRRGAAPAPRGAVAADLRPGEPRLPQGDRDADHADVLHARRVRAAPRRRRLRHLLRLQRVHGGAA